MKSLPHLAAALAVGVLFAATTSLSAQAQEVLAINSPPISKPARVVPDSRWDASFAAFAAADKIKTPAAGGVLFVGSSSIRMWDDLEQDFQSQPVVVKRGFGGSRMLDCAQHLEKLVVPYKPRLVLVYAGDNDLAEGRSPQDVLKSFTDFVEGVRESLPNTRIAYISIKPSPSRQHLMPQIREANSMIRAYASLADNTDFIDIFSPMLSESGAPRQELFTSDNLHMNDSGYDLWQKVITAHLK